MKGHRPRAAWKRWFDEWSSDAWLRWIEREESAGRLLRLGDVWVDGRNLFDRRFRCDPSTCTRGRREAGYRSCCADLTVELTDAERRDLGAWWPEIRATLAERDASFDSDTPFADMVDEGPGLGLSLARRRGRCAFSYLDGEGIRCAIHAACFAHPLDRHAVQPRSCSLFPLMLVDLPRGWWLLSAYDAEGDGPTDFSDSANLPCLQGRRGPRVYEALADTLTHVFGEAFRADLEAAAEEWRGR